jgi:hypothetical protein
MEAAAIPGIAIPLLQDDCVDTNVDMDAVWEIIHLTSDDKTHRLNLDNIREEVDGWFSDYDYFNTQPTNPTCDQPFSRQVGICVREAVSGTIVVTDGGDGSFIWNVTTFY